MAVIPFGVWTLERAYPCTAHPSSAWSLDPTTPGRVVIAAEMQKHLPAIAKCDFLGASVTQNGHKWDVVLPGDAGSYPRGDWSWVGYIDTITAVGEKRISPAMPLVFWSRHRRWIGTHETRQIVIMPDQIEGLSAGG